jgi:sugar lactone lactonase YvrE
MGARELRTLCEGGSYFEAPRWHEGRWWASDFYRHGVFAFDTDGREELVLEVEGQPSGLGWLPDTLIVAETFAGRLTAFSIAADGALTDRRVWGQIAPTVTPGTIEEMLPNLGFAPDGCCMDAEGRTLLLCAAADFIEANRKHTREAALLTTTVDVPHGARP